MNKKPVIMPVNIIAGGAGAGKSTFARVFSTNPLVIDMESRWSNYPPEMLEGIEIVDVLKECINTETYKLDSLKTMKLLRELRTKILKKKPGAIIFDGISSIKEMAVDEWVSKHPGRQRPSKYEWGDVYQIVLDVILPLMMYCRFNKIPLFLTSLMKDEYDKKTDEATGEKIIDCLEHIKVNSDAIWVTEYDGDDYILSTVKHQLDQCEPFEWTIRKEEEDDSETEKSSVKIVTKKKTTRRVEVSK